MPLPALVKSWQYNVNQAIGASGVIATTRKNLFYAIVNSLLTFPLNPWTVDYSCDSITAGTVGDGVNRWVAPANLVWHSTLARSWIVLKQAGLGSGFRLLLELLKPVGGTLEVSIRASISPNAGFTGGTTTSPPTATDSFSLRDGVQGDTSDWGSGQGVDFTTALHVLQSTDGESTRVFVNQGNFTTAMWIFDKPANPVTGWNNPVIGMIYGTFNSLHAPTFPLLNVVAFSATKPPCAGRGVSSMQLAWTSEGHRGGPEGVVIAVPNDLNGEYAFSPIGLSSETSLNRGRHGYINDLWWGNAIVAHGTTYPNDASRQFVQFGNIVTVWNGSVPLLA